MQTTDTKSIPVTIIEAPRGLVPLNLRELWSHRELIWFMLFRDLKGRYRQMVLGPVWIILHPLINMVIFTVIFSRLAKLPSDGLPYPLFNYSALLPWTFFSSAVSSTANSLLVNRGLISKVYFPRLIVPVVGVLMGLIDFLISFVILGGMLAWYGQSITWTIVYLPAMLLLAATFALGIGLWLACAIVYFHDVADILAYGMRLLMYSAPVVYASSVIPDRWMWLYRLNPVTQVVEGFRWALLGAGTPINSDILWPVLFSLALLVSGAYHFRRTERSIVDIA